jgi:isoquinoline 1-oxidoreductase subunit beta
MKRRTLILSGLAGAGALLVGWGVMPERSRLGKGELLLPQSGEVALNGWIKIAQDGTVLMAMPRSEMGQGIHTALPMLVAEELDVPLGQVRIVQAGLDAIYGNVAMFVASLPFHPNQDGSMLVKTGEWMTGKLARELGVVVTGGSSSVADAWGSVRLAAATARAQLAQAAASKLGVSVDALVFHGGKISAGDKSVNFAVLAGDAAVIQVSDVKLKDAKAFKLVGTSAPRNDVPAKVNGTAQFGMDVRLPGMVFAAVKLCPMLGGSPGAFDASKALAIKGVERVMQLPAAGGGTAGLAVIGMTTWHARQGAAAVEVQWQQRPLGALDSAAIEKELAQIATRGGGFAFHSRGDADAAEQTAARKIEALYNAPYLAHATMEPMNCTAQLKDGKLTLWVPTQVPQMARDAAAKVAGIDKVDVTVNVTQLGGGFGRRLEVDFIAQAVHVAKQTAGRPVQLVYSREEDMTHDVYRPAHAALMRASVDANGRVSSLRIQSAGDAITPRWFERAFPLLAGPVDAPDKTTAEGLFDLPYDFAHQHMSHSATRMGVPVGYWRSVGHSHNAFFSESFVDELAQATQTDPLAFRRQHLSSAHAQRHLAVLNLAAEKASWGKKLPEGHAQGIALHESFGSVVAQVVQVSIDKGVDKGVPRVHKVVCAVDCGQVVNPGIIAQQMEGSVVFALSAALWGKIDIVGGIVQQQNYPQYRMLKLSETPLVETHLVQSNAKPTGIGEPGVPPLAPALANALFALTGQRARSLPLFKA